MVTDAAIVALAEGSLLFSHDWPERGTAPHGYIKGMALAFAEAYRRLKAGDPTLSAITKTRLDAADHDTLPWYAPELANAGARDDDAAARLVALYALMLGLGMRESSGRHCEGPDTPEDRGPPGHPVETTPENAEAGLFQVSFDSLAHHADRQALVDAFAGKNDLQDVFAEGANCAKAHHWPAEVGSGAAAAFQKLTKECPLFATLYAALLMRQMYNEWGPLIRKKAEVRRDAVDLFNQVKDVVDRA